MTIDMSEQPKEPEGVSDLGFGAEALARHELTARNSENLSCTTRLLIQRQVKQICGAGVTLLFLQYQMRSIT